MLEERIEHWYEKIGKKLVMLIAAVVAVWVILRLRILGLFAPFILAWIFASILNYFVTWANKKLNIPRSAGTILSMLTILSALLSLITFLLKQLWYQVVGFIGSMPEYTDQIITEFRRLEEKFGHLLQSLPISGDISSFDNFMENVSNGMTTFLGGLVPSAYNAVARVPDFIIFVVIMLLSTFFMTKDYYDIKDFIKAQLSDTIVDKMVIMQQGVLKAIGGYVRTQLILMSMTFTICLIGFFIFGIPYALLLAIVIAVIDALPVFGSGTILIPWAVYNIIVGKYSLGVGLLAIYGIIFVVRQFTEPKILSAQIGVYALTTIMAVYIGYKTIGVLGLIVGPLVVVVAKMLQSVGAIPQFKPVKINDSRGDKNETN